jgi:hypothetical protein
MYNNISLYFLWNVYEQQIWTVCDKNRYVVRIRVTVTRVVSTSVRITHRFNGILRQNFRYCYVRGQRLINILYEDKTCTNNEHLERQ